MDIKRWADMLKVRVVIWVRGPIYPQLNLNK